MRRALSIAAVLAVAVPVCLAQHGGAGHAGGGFSGYHGGFVSGPGRMAAGAPRVMGSAPQVSGTPGRFVAPYSAPLYRGGVSNGYGWRGGAYRGRGNEHGRGGYRGGYGAVYPWVNSWAVLPWDLGYYDYGDNGTADYGTDQNGQPEYPDNGQQGYGPEYGPEYGPDGGQQAGPQGAPQSGPGMSGVPAPPPDYGYRPAYQAEAAAPAAPTMLAKEPELTLIYKDGHTETVRNFVLTPTTVIDLDKADTGREERIPLAELNVSATEKAAEQAGLEFNPPA